MTKLYVICGHGHGDSGAVGGGKTEADLVRKLAAKMKAMGGPSVEVLDTSKNWYEQKLVNSALKKKVGNNPVIELHMDSVSGPAKGKAKGGHVIIDADLSADKYDKALADYISKKFPGRSDKLVKRNNLGNLNSAQAQGINYRLIECCFIDHKGDREKFVADMDEIAAGILGCFGISAAQIGNYRILKEGLWVWDSPKKGSKKLVQMHKGNVKKVTATKEADGNLWAAFTAKGTGKTRYFKIRSLNGKNVYAEKV